LIKNNENKIGNPKRNWYTQLTNLISKYKISLTSESRLSCTEKTKCREILWKADKGKVSEWRNLKFYEQYTNFQRNEPGHANYLDLGLAWKDKRLIAQCRLNSKFLSYNVETFIFNSEVSKCCNKQGVNSLWHMVSECAIQCGPICNTITSKNLSLSNWGYFTDKCNREEYIAFKNEILCMLRRRNIALEIS